VVEVIAMRCNGKTGEKTQEREITESSLVSHGVSICRRVPGDYNR